MQNVGVLFVLCPLLQHLHQVPGMRLLERPRRRSVPWVFQDQSELQSIVRTVPYR